MSSETQEVLLAASELLSYPDERRLERLPELAEWADSLGGRSGRALSDFLRYARSIAPLSLQECYVRTFDFQGGVPLFLTYPRFKDDRARGQVLVELKQRYRAAGFTPVDQELPDYLPMVLEFLGMAGPKDARALAREFGPLLHEMSRTLRARSSPYHVVMEACAQAAAQLAGASRLAGGSD